MNITPDSIIHLSAGPLAIPATVTFTWLVMIILVVSSWLATRRITADPEMSRWQNMLETVVSFLRDQIRDITNQDPGPYLPFIGTLFLFIALSNVLTIVPGYHPPTGSLYTTGALALCVFFAVPYYGIRKKGLLGYLRHYVQPNVIMLPFNIIGEFSRTLALAVRLFGNIMSGTIVVAVIVSLAPLFLPLIMQALGLIIGFIQAYIFAVLATVYIASATQVAEEREET